MIMCQFLADRDQIVARIKTFGNLADGLTECFPISQVHGPREDIDLPAGIVDIIFARDGIARKFED